MRQKITDILKLVPLTLQSSEVINITHAVTIGFLKLFKTLCMSPFSRNELVDVLYIVKHLQIFCKTKTERSFKDLCRRLDTVQLHLQLFLYIYIRNSPTIVKLLLKDQPLDTFVSPTFQSIKKDDRVKYLYHHLQLQADPSPFLTLMKHFEKALIHQRKRLPIFQQLANGKSIST